MFNTSFFHYLTNHNDKNKGLHVTVEGFLFAQKFHELRVNHGVHVFQQKGP